MGKVFADVLLFRHLGKIKLKRFAIYKEIYIIKS